MVMTAPVSRCSMETPTRAPVHQTTRALRLSALLRIQRSTSWRGITGSENSSIAPFRDRFRTRQSMVEDRPLNAILPASYVRRLSLLRCSFILRSLFDTPRSFNLWFSNGSANLSLLLIFRTTLPTNGFTPFPRTPSPGTQASWQPKMPGLCRYAKRSSKVPGFRNKQVSIRVGYGFKLWRQR